MITQLRVGIPVVGGTNWFGGVSFIEAHMQAVTVLPPGERPQIFLIITDGTLSHLEHFYPFIEKFNGFIYVGDNPAEVQKIIKQPILHCTSQDDLFKNIDLYFPVCFNVLPGYPAASWIPDFQHKYLPDFFSSQEIAARDEMCRRIAEQAKLVFCSSRAVEKDFWHFYPASRAVTRVLALRILPKEDWYKGDPSLIQAKYSLPERFILCSNQFWTHKNHPRLFEAIALLRQSGLDVHLVCTGLTGDYRSPAYFENILHYIEELGIKGLVHILGLIPRAEQILLLRRSLFVVQPSLFEGLSLIVQECRALGKTILLSDIDILLEYEYGIYFNRTDPQDLAQKIAALLTVAEPGPEPRRETEAKLQAAGLAAKYARDFCRFVEEAAEIYGRRPSQPDPGKSPDQETITVATSLPLTGDRQLLHTTLGSWQQSGFRIVSFNTPEEIAVLNTRYPQVEFVPVPRTAMQKYGKPGIYLHDILTYLLKHGSAVCGIIESDILLANCGLAAYVSKEASGCLLYGDRVKITTVDSPSAPELPDYLGFVFFDREFVSRCPHEEFCLGLPWWDYWLVIFAAVSKIPLKKISTPLAYHSLHSSLSTSEDWLSLGTLLAKYVEPSFPLTSETVSAYHQGVVAELAKRSTVVTLPETDTAGIPVV